MIKPFELKQPTLVAVTGPVYAGKQTMTDGMLRFFGDQADRLGVSSAAKKMAKHGSYGGQVVQKYSEVGELIPWEPLNLILMRALDDFNRDEFATTYGTVLDGGFRSMPEARFWMNYAAEHRLALVVIHIDDDPIECYRRFYSQYCAGTTAQNGRGVRADDQPKLVKKRLRIYSGTSLPAIRWAQSVHPQGFIRIKTDGAEQKLAEALSQMPDILALEDQLIPSDPLGLLSVEFDDVEDAPWFDEFDGAVGLGSPTSVGAVASA